MTAEKSPFLARLTGCFSLPAGDNPTVAMLEAAFRHRGLNWRYINCEVAPERLGDAVRGARAMGWAGFNCSMPYKIAVIEHLDGLGRSAEIIGAVNTVVRDGDRFLGENTDGRGFVQALRGLTDPAGKSVMIFGAGGAARAVAVEMALAGAASVSVVNRDPLRGQSLAALVAAETPARAQYHPWTPAFRIPEGTDIVINNTSIGLAPQRDARLDVDFNTLRPGMVLADGIPNPPRTHWIQEGERRGCRVMDGLSMLVCQGVIAAHYWTGVDVDPGVMRKALEQALSL